MAKNILDWIALILLIIGGLNWGLAIWDINLVTMLFGSIDILVTIVYALVGLSALYTIYYLFKK
jgi:uncharacterized protein